MFYQDFHRHGFLDQTFTGVPFDNPGKGHPFACLQPKPFCHLTHRNKVVILGRCMFVSCLLLLFIENTKLTVLHMQECNMKGGFNNEEDTKAPSER